MKGIVMLMAVAGLAAPAMAQTAPAAPEQLQHTQTSFDLMVHAPLSVTAPLFGPEGERAWAGKHWNPKFVFPQPANDVEGAVFAISHGPLSATWVTTRFDVEGRHFQYVYFLPGLMVTVIDVRFKPVNADATAVNVVYTRTAIAPEGNEHVEAMSEGDKSSGKEWQEAIDAYLASAKQGQRP